MLCRYLPFGLDWTLTNAIVSALVRSLTEENEVTVGRMIQTNAAISPGDIITAI